MAANLQRTRGLAKLGKRLAGQIRSRDSLAISQLHCRSVQASAYDKNPEENVNSTVVPDHVIPPQPDEYWAPHPKTGVFGPATDENPGSGHNPGAANGGSVLEEKAFFRPQEDLDKPPVQP
ncbi:late embryogenesis abundant protein At5g17165 [Salvia miltiorrhiza]|uniref:late embryogenesis abundant protein At5g17165 n=1 Tax=Salvia miltiorrhiza TaxID=226208 RepID=UPI0025ACC0AC|nr:late embryogenesis abundant protein At5g17165 [Salvia miltiorrhiza]